MTPEAMGRIAFLCGGWDEPWLKMLFDEIGLIEAQARAEALEEAAKVAECWFSFDKHDETGKRIASSIRSLPGAQG